jgi:aspartate/methionine/tyrosine aminotransferase
MKFPPFQLERYFAAHEFNAPYVLSASDCEPLQLVELLSMADAQTLELWQGLGLGYTESTGHPLLRQEIGQLYDTVRPGEILVCAPEEGIFVAMNLLLSPGDQVIAMFPAYQSLYTIAESMGCQVIRWHPQEQGGWRFDPEWLASRITDRTKLVIINFPHNPTGTLVTPDELQAIVSLAARHGVWLFSDEMYRFLEHDPDTRLPAVVDRYERGISLSGMSKAFSLAGLRIGWLATHDNELYAELATFKDYTTICSSAPSEILSLIGLRARSRIVARNLSIIKENLELVNQMVQQHRSLFHWQRPCAGSVGLVKLLQGDVEAFCEASRKQAGVLLLPGSVFDFPGNYFRIGLGRQDTPPALQQLDQFLNKCEGTMPRRT